MSVVHLFPESYALVERELARNPLTPSDLEAPPTAGLLGELYRAPMRAFSNLGAAGTLAVAGALRTQGITAADDTLFPIVDRFRAARDWWTAEPGEVGTAGRVVGGLAEFGTLLGVGLGNPALALGTTQMTTATDLAQQGVAPLRAVAAGTAEGAANAVAFQVPFLGKTFAQRVLFGAGANAAAGAGVGLAVQQVLQSGGYDQQAEAYDPWNLEARAIDALTGALFGGVSWYTDPPRPKAEPPPPEPAAAGAEAPPPADAPMPAPDGVDPRTLVDRPILDATWTPDPELLDASALLNAHQHRVVQLAPGRPRTPEALDAHVAAIRQAVAELAADEPVTASVRPDEFEPLPPSPEVQRAQEAMREVLGAAPVARRRLIPELVERAKSAIRAALLAAKEKRDGNPNFVLMPVSREAIEEAASVGWDLEGYSHAVDRSAILHIFKRHGDAAAESKRGQIAITDADIEAVPEVIGDPDYTVYGLSNKIGRDLVAYIKRMPDGSTLYLEEKRTGRKTLSAQSMRKYPGTTNATSLIESLRPTSETLPGDGLRVIEHRVDGNQPARARQTDQVRTPLRARPDASVGSEAPSVPEVFEASRPQTESSPAAGRAAPDLETQLTTDAAREAITADPELQIVDDDGNVLSAADALAAAEAETRTVETLANGTQALAACAIRFMGG